MKKLLITLILLQTTIYAATAQRYRGYNDDFPRFRIGAQGGWSYIIAPIASDVPADFRNYYKQLKSGYSFTGDAAYYFTKVIGIGLKYSFFRTSNSIDNVYTVDSVTKKVTTGSLSDLITIQFIGPTFNTRIITDNQRFHFNFYASLGYLWYKNDAMLITPYVLKSGTMGSALGVGVDWSITPSLFAGVDVSGVFGALSYYDYTDANGSKTITLDENKQEGVSRIDLSAGIRWNF